MNWNYPFGTTEYIFIFLFLLLYVTYFLRMLRITRQLQTTSRSLFIKFFLRCIAFALLMMALLGPSFGEAGREIQAEGKDIYLLTDLSKSMDATDVVPSRLEKIKFEINRLISSAGTNRLGLIVFSNEAYVQAPLTFDQAALELFVQSLQTDLLPRSGTHACSALDLAYQKLISGAQASNQAKMMVLFTDGENTGTCPATLLNNIRRFGIRVFVVGVGTKVGSSIPADGQVLRTGNGEMVISKLNPAALQKLAEQTNGSYYEVNNEKNELPRLVADINSASGRLIDSRTVAVTTNKYYYFLAGALFLLIIDVLVTVRTFRL
ncbi:vWA domain-containing protein [Telluribacter sp.]|jgi:Ca-activated chloride channel family protein|uniref:vWA domain-containing protein n=1 Tax=Telluribacter sp. TaxID=1978767 RepID=UPI002E11A890|nr:VWA domain-containing protein [Telluribacter sp.]